MRREAAWRSCRYRTQVVALSVAAPHDPKPPTRLGCCRWTSSPLPIAPRAAVRGRQAHALFLSVFEENSSENKTHEKISETQTASIQVKGLKLALLASCELFMCSSPPRPSNGHFTTLFSSSPTAVSGDDLAASLTEKAGACRHRFASKTPCCPHLGPSSLPPFPAPIKG